MLYAEVYKATEKIRRKYGRCNPFELCKEMDIKLIPIPFGTETNSIKGFYREERRIKVIVYNCDLPEIIQRIIIFHEIGHAILHTKGVCHAFHDVTLFETNSMMENEANLFAAEYMLDDDEVMDTINEDNTFFSSAGILGVPSEFLDFKFRIMKWKGYRLIEPPVRTKSTFLKNVEVNGYYE